MKTLKQVPSDYKKLPDEERVFRYVERNEQIALSYLFERYGHLTFGVCLHYLGNDQSAKKNTEEIFIRLATELQRFKTGSFKSWLFDFVNLHCNKRLDDALITEQTYHSSCLTKKQLENLATAAMTNDELQAVDAHIANCRFCSQAVTGLKTKDRSAEVLKALNGGFLKEYFSARYPHIHLNSITHSKPLVAAHPHPHRHRNKKQNKHAWRPSTVAMIILLAGGLFWYKDSGKNFLRLHNTRQQNMPVQTTAVQPSKAEANNAVNTDPIRNTVADKVPATHEQPVATNEETKPENAIAKANAVTAPKLVENKTPEHKVNEEKSAPKQQKLAVTVPDATREVPETTSRKHSGFWGIFSPAPERNEDSENKITKGDALFENGQYKAAVHSYKEGMKSDNRSQRHEAGIMAAQSYINLGEKDKAAKILQDIIDEGGPEARSARKILNDLDEE